MVDILSLVECLDLRDQELTGSVYPSYAYDWLSRLKAKLSLPPADVGTYLTHFKERLSPQASRKVAFLGFIPHPDLVDLYYKADVFAFTPIWDEGFGIPTVKAMAAEPPVVATHSRATWNSQRSANRVVGQQEDPCELAGSILNWASRCRGRPRGSLRVTEWCSKCGIFSGRNRGQYMPVDAARQRTALPTGRLVGHVLIHKAPI